MEKNAFILALLAGVIFANICCKVNDETLKQQSAETQVAAVPQNRYGAYLAGRVAHSRHDLNAAADYYMLAEESAPENQMLSSQLYVILTSQGRIEEAAKYADKVLEKKDGSLMIYTVKATYEIKQQNYEKALENVSKSNNPFAKVILNPLLNAWSYAGLNQYEKAIESLTPLRQGATPTGIYLLHAGMISDYLGRVEEADKFYSALMNMRGLQLSLFPVNVISNFYLRQNKRYKVKAVFKMAENKIEPSTQKMMEDMKNSDSSIKPLLTSPDIGVSEALFDVSLILQNEKNGTELALLFAALAAYANPDYDMANIVLANILEDKELYREANEIYKRITPDKYDYYAAQTNIASNLTRLKQYKEAEEIMMNLLKEDKPTANIYLGLGEIARMTERYRDATIYYQKAIDLFRPEQQTEKWITLMTLSAAYESMKDSKNSEKALREAITIDDNAMAKNHLGYVLIRDRRNLEEAFKYVVEAYIDVPYEGSIVDSVGWGLYQVGKYKEAAKMLEMASDLSPSEAVIYDHLGDAYWEVGRRDEAVFQWNHALSMPDEFKSVDKDEVKAKIENGKQPNQPAPCNPDLVEDIIRGLSINTDRPYPLTPATVKFTTDTPDESVPPAQPDAQK